MANWTAVYIGVYAYGESRFNITFDPCFANIRSMCPVNSSVPIEANGVIPIGPSDVAGIPELALTIPDFEGQAILRIFSNSTQSQIACYSAVLTNGHSMSHPAAVGSVVGLFVFAAMIASIAVAIYGTNLQETRKHYAHSLSIFVVFAVLQHVFFSGALSMNWPSVLVAFWSNFGWASGMISTHGLQQSINQFVKTDRGNIRQFGTAAAGADAVNLGGGYSLTAIYKRYLQGALRPYDGYSNIQARASEHTLSKRALIDASSGFKWYGNLVEPGLPLPGNFSGFAGTLGQLNIPASNAFLTGFLWFLIMLLVMVAIVLVLKVSIEALSMVKLVKTKRLAFFRTAWIYCMGITILRTCYVAFFMMIFLTLFQFTLGGVGGVLGIAAIVFVLFLLGMVGLSAYALRHRLGRRRGQEDASQTTPRKTTRFLRWRKKGVTADTSIEITPLPDTSPAPQQITNLNQRPHAHDDDDHLIKFGWLSARFRRSKWWFFAAWLVYEFVRACFYGGAAGYPLTQVFGLLVWEILALIVIIIMKPFESNRLNILMVYLLGFSKVVCVALSSAFDPRFRLNRILTTVIGIVIIVIQGALIICLLVCIVIGCISSWMSVRRHEENFRPKGLATYRTRYFEHLNHKATDKPRPVVVAPEVVTDAKSKDPYFSITSVRRETKIEDDDPEHEFDEVDIEQAGASTDAINRQAHRSSQALSLKSMGSTSNLPYGARRHRASWSTRDFSNANLEAENVASGLEPRMSMDAIGRVDTPVRATGTPSRSRTHSRGSWGERPSLDNVAYANLERMPVDHGRSQFLPTSHAQEH